MKAHHQQRELEDIPAPARQLAAEAIGIDSHIDAIQRVLVMDRDLAKRSDIGHVDIPRLQVGGTHAPFFAFWVPVYFPGAEAVRRTLGFARCDAIAVGPAQRQAVLDGRANELIDLAKVNLLR